MTIGENIRRFRERKGVNMKQAAADIGMPYTTYLNYEYNRREPGIDALTKIAEYLDVSIDDILGTKKDTPDEDVPVESVYQFLLESGFVKEGEDLSDDDLSFLSAIIAALRDWFITRNA